MSPTPRNLLTLTDDHLLTQEETWLKDAYTNIVVKLIKSALTVVSKFDPIASKYYGIDSVKTNQFEYQALLEATSYFWASKGGRGRLLEKIIASVAGTSADTGVSLVEIPLMISKRKHDSIRTEGGWHLRNPYKKLKFDLINIKDNSLVLMELKNRVDSGGTAAREEALSKKFFAICRWIERGEKIFEYDKKTYDLLEILSQYGIKRIEMYMGLLYDINGKEATVERDKIGGFYSRSKTLMNEYYKEEHSSKINYDESKLELSFEKNGVTVLIGTAYGNDVTMKFMRKEFPISGLIERIFSKSWDDLWLALNLTISELSLLRQEETNHLLEIERLINNNSDFRNEFARFCSVPNYMVVVDNLIKVVNKTSNFAVPRNRHYDDQ